MDTSASSPATTTVAGTTTLLGDAPEVRSRADRLPELCQTGVILRALLFVQVVVGAGAAFGSPTLAAWCLRSAVAAAVAVPATLGWLIAACSATPLLAKLPKPARVACVGAAGGLAAWAACVPLDALQLVAGDRGATGNVIAVVTCGALMGAVIYHWLELRMRATLPAATEARLVELQARVRPHFLFNTLNTAIALVRVDPGRAEEVMEDLAELFRAALGALEGESTLGEEIRLARMYLDIEGMRFGKRLKVEWDVDDAVAAARVPPLLLQPLVENAVRHGIEPNDTPGLVQIRARIRNGRAWLQVLNTVGAPGPSGHGIGLASARERLRLMHDIDAEFQSGPVEGGRYRVRLAVPLATRARRAEARMPSGRDPE
jgi:two-component system sensor histidine kinase AlgZ